jgi:hypothetical protein
VKASLNRQAEEKYSGMVSMFFLSAHQILRLSSLQLMYMPKKGITSFNCVAQAFLMHMD